MRADCPKCGSQNAWYAKTQYDLVLKCVCGLEKVVFSTLGEAEISHSDVEDEVKLPREGTFLRKTLMVLSILPEATSAEITSRLHDLGENFTVSDVASYLTILRGKGLVFPVTIRRGVSGGSTWTLTDRASDLIGI